MNAVDERVLALIASAVPRRLRRIPITPETKLHGGLGLDSLALLSLVFRLEDALQIRLDLAEVKIDIGALHTVGDVLEMTRTLLEPPVLTSKP